MSDAPNNPDRSWDAGLRDDDLIALIAIRDDGERLVAADEPVVFSVDSLRQSEGTSALGSPKSASEGAERDRTWPAVIPSRNGIVRSVSAQKLVVDFGGDGRPDRPQTYTLNGKYSYVSPGQPFIAEVSILAGTPPSVANLAQYLAQKYVPLDYLQSENAVDRYSAVKALPRRPELATAAIPALETLIASESEERVRLEAAGSAASMGSQLGEDKIADTLQGNGRADIRMEAVLILTELRNTFARDQLLAVATADRFIGDEIRQAAVWGLGKVGLKAYVDLLPFIADPDDNVAMHAIVAFGPDTPIDVIRKLVDDLANANPRTAASASRALQQINGAEVAKALVDAARTGTDWVVATLGRLTPEIVRSAVSGSALEKQVAPLLLLNQAGNWLGSEDRTMDLAFLDKQNV